MLKNSPEILAIIKRDFFHFNCVHSDQQIWYKWCHSYFSTVWSYLLCCLSKGPLKRDFFDIYLTTFFGIRNFGNTSVMSVIFFSKLLIYISKMQQKKLEKTFCFSENWSWIGCVNFSLLKIENLWPTANMFTKSPKILHITKRDFFRLNCLDFDTCKT